MDEEIKKKLLKIKKKKVPCPRCHEYEGKGKYPCRICYAVRLQNDGLPIACSHCDGTGYVTCPRCDGEGVLEAEEV